MAGQRRQVTAEERQNHHPAQAAMREAEARVAHYFLLRAGEGGALTARALAFVATVSGKSCVDIWCLSVHAFIRTRAHAGERRGGWRDAATCCAQDN